MGWRAQADWTPEQPRTLLPLPTLSTETTATKGALIPGFGHNSSVFIGLTLCFHVLVLRYGTCVGHMRNIVCNELLPVVDRTSHESLPSYTEKRRGIILMTAWYWRHYDIKDGRVSSHADIKCQDIHSSSPTRSCHRANPANVGTTSRQWLSNPAILDTWTKMPALCSTPLHFPVSDLRS